MHSFKSIGFFLFGLAAVSMAAPAESYKRKLSPRCSLAKIKLPTEASGLPTPPGAPKHVLLGVGTQNFTCTGSTADIKPVANGAIADLFDASCIAKDPATFARVTKRAYQLVQKNGPGRALRDMVIGLIGSTLKVGTHYFTNPTTPKFEFATDDFFLGAKRNNIPSPEGTANADWLLLGDIGSTSGYTSVYRVVTQGGIPPVNCDKQKGLVKVPYTAQYFLY